MTATIQDPWAQPTPAGAYDDLLVRALPLTHAQRRWEPADGPLPALFVSHGAPPTLDEPQWLQDLFAWAQSMPKPRAIVIVSAHWEDAPVAISSAAASTPLVYDFGGFHPRYYTLQYRTPDATALAHQGPSVVEVITDPNALSIPPEIKKDQVFGFATAMSRIVLNRGVGEAVSMARSNLRNIPRG